MAEDSTEKIRQRVDSSKFFNCRVTLLKIANLQQKHYGLRQSLLMAVNDQISAVTSVLTCLSVRTHQRHVYRTHYAKEIPPKTQLQWAQ